MARDREIADLEREATQEHRNLESANRYIDHLQALMRRNESRREPHQVPTTSDTRAVRSEIAAAFLKIASHSTSRESLYFTNAQYINFRHYRHRRVLLQQ